MNACERGQGRAWSIQMDCNILYHLATYGHASTTIYNDVEDAELRHAGYGKLLVLCNQTN